VGRKNASWNLMIEVSAPECDEQICFKSRYLKKIRDQNIGADEKSYTNNHSAFRACDKTYK
jgi:hypothetical protein